MPDLNIKENPTDPIAVIIGTIGTTLAGLHVPSKLGLTVDQFAMVVSGAITIAAAVRAYAIARNKKADQ